MDADEVLAAVRRAVSGYSGDDARDLYQRLHELSIDWEDTLTKLDGDDADPDDLSVPFDPDMGCAVDEDDYLDGYSDDTDPDDADFGDDDDADDGDEPLF